MATPRISGSETESVVFGVFLNTILYNSVNRITADPQSAMNDEKYPYDGIFEWVNRRDDFVDKSGKTNHYHPYSNTWKVWLKQGEKVYTVQKDNGENNLEINIEWATIIN